jgi:hypothetical protein
VVFNGAGGTPSSLTGTNITGVPIATGITGSLANLATALSDEASGWATFNATPSCANFASFVTGETGSCGSIVLSTSPQITTSLTTDSTTFALLNTTATTVNAFGAATTVNTGASATQIWNFGGSTTASEFRYLEPSGSGTNYTAFKAQAQGASITYTLPATVGGAGTFLTDSAGNGTLSWATPAGSGDVTKVGTPSNNQMAVWTGDGTLEGTSDFTYDGTSLNLITGKNFQIAAATVLSDSGGTLTLDNIDALATTTENTIEAAIDTLANLTSIQGQTFTLTGAFIRSGAHSFTMTSTGTTNVTFPTTGTLAISSGAQTFTGTQTITQIDMGNTDTSITRSAAGILAVEGVDLLRKTDAPIRFVYLLANCQNTTANIGVGLFTSNSPTAECYGTNNRQARLVFPDTADLTEIQGEFVLPATFSSVTANLIWSSSGTGNAVPQFWVACTSSGDAPNDTWVSTTATTSAQLDAGDDVLYTLTLTTTGCVGNDRISWRLGRENDHGSDTLSATFRPSMLFFEIAR